MDTYTMNSFTEEKFTLTAVRLVEEAILSNESVDTPEHAIELLKGIIDDYNREVVAAIYIKPPNTFVTACIISIGSVSFCTFNNRDIITPALLTNSTDIIIVHTHPSGNLSPSRDDLKAVDKLKAACDLMGLNLLDSIIAGPTTGYYSFKEHNLV